MKSVRLRLLMLALLPLVVLLPIFLAFTMHRWTEKFDDLLISKVASDLRIAEQYMQRIVTTQGNQIEGLARSTGFQEASAQGESQLLVLLEQSRIEIGLDYLVVRPSASTLYLAPESIVRQQALAGDTATAIEIFTAGELAEIAPQLAERAAIPLMVTEAAIPSERQIETRGMVVLAATLVSVEGVDAVLIGGTLLNQNLGFIDTINDLVYPADGVEDSQTGTATLFLEDVRISTNVRLFENVRALGTRVSEVVYRTVLDDGQTWLDRAFVVNDWYISGYLPIVDSHNSRIGMLYVGYLEEPFVALKTRIYIALVSAFILIIALSVPFFLWIARGIFSPLEQMNQTMRRVEQGEFNARIGTIQSNDEIGEVARHFDDLLDQVQERDRELRDWADTLNERVDQRTKQLHQANDKLEETYKRLVISGKLASIGEITAGVAHEINNPVAVIQGNIDVLRMSLGPQVSQHLTELDLVDAQVRRINSIVGKLLQFAKPGDFAENSVCLDVDDILEGSLTLVQHSLTMGEISVSFDYDDVAQVKIDPGELQQVLVNLLINAIQAMPDGGELYLHVHAAMHDGQKGICIGIRDTGGGISQDHADHIFDPFFTKKRSQGTGLGLSISQSLIQRAGGNITFTSSLGIGSEFFVWLPKVSDLTQKISDQGAKVDNLS